MKRKCIAIFVAVATGGNIDPYVFYLAKKIKEVVETLAITINGVPAKSDVDELEKYSDMVFIRDNVGFDCGAYKDTLETYIGWEKIVDYEELLLLNDSCFGPIYPLSDVFETMDKRKLDFWGITEQTPIRSGRYSKEVLPYHIQTYFLVVRKRILKDAAFWKFWRDVKLSNEYGETVANFELKFTRYFNHLGYLSGAYIDCGAFCKSIDETEAYVFMDSYRLISEHKCPFLKKKVFFFPQEKILSSNAGETAYKSLKYVQEHTQYDEGLIWNYLVKKCDINDLRTVLHLNYCLSNERLQAKQTHHSVMCIAVFIEADNIDKCLSYIGKLPEYVDLVIAADQTDINLISKKGILLGRAVKYVNYENKEELKELLLLSSSHQYICLIHDKGINLSDHLSRESYINLIWENLISNDIYTANILDIFERNPRLGFLCPPAPYMADTFAAVARGYGQCYKIMKKICDSIGLVCNIDEKKLSFSYGNVFWCRTNALSPLLNADNLHNAVLRELIEKNMLWSTLEKLYPYIAQSRGYYSGVVMTEEYASVYTANYHYMLGKIVKDILLDRGIIEFKNVRRINPRLVEFCQRHDRIYLYGAGECGNECLVYLRMRGICVEGFIVSDGRRIDNVISGINVSELSEIEIKPKMGIVLALGVTHSKEIGVILEEKGMHDYIQYEI